MWMRTRKVDNENDKLQCYAVDRVRGRNAMRWSEWRDCELIQRTGNERANAMQRTGWETAMLCSGQGWETAMLCSEQGERLQCYAADRIERLQCYAANRVKDCNSMQRTGLRDCDAIQRTGLRDCNAMQWTEWKTAMLCANKGLRDCNAMQWKGWKTDQGVCSEKAELEKQPLNWDTTTRDMHAYRIAKASVIFGQPVWSGSLDECRMRKPRKTSVPFAGEKQKRCLAWQLRWPPLS